MKRSTERILTTHAGRLPNPDNIAALSKPVPTAIRPRLTSSSRLAR